MIQPERLSDSIVAEQMLAADFINSIGPKLTSATSAAYVRLRSIADIRAQVRGLAPDARDPKPTPAVCELRRKWVPARTRPRLIGSPWTATRLLR
jgi:hypothetical protein